VERVGKRGRSWGERERKRARQRKFRKMDGDSKIEREIQKNNKNERDVRGGGG